MKCKVIQDLLPLYAEKLTSEESNELVEEHLEGCEECQKFYEDIKAEETHPTAEAQDVRPLKKIKRRTMLKIIAGFVGGVLLLGTLFAFLFVGVIPASRNQLDVTYTGERLENGDIQITFRVETDDAFCLGARGEYQYFTNPDGDPDFNAILRFYRVFALPFDDRGEEPNVEYLVFTEKEFYKHYSLHIDCVNSIFDYSGLTYDLYDIAVELGLQEAEEED